MPIPNDDARRLLAELDGPDLANFMAQAEARHVLLEVGEAPENFPPFTVALDERITGLAYIYLAAGCSLIEQGERAEGAAALERAARLLRNVHGPHAATSKESAFHILLAAMAAYAAGQYSWAFIMLKTVPPLTETVRLVSAFLRRDREAMQATIGQVVSGEGASFKSDDDLTEAAIGRAIARTLAFTAEFMYAGDPAHLERARAELEDAATIALESMSPASWWIVRVLKLMLADLEDASPWTVLPPHFGSGAALPDDLERYVRLLAFDELRPVYELWRSQREALPHALGTNPGAVISLKTGGGKTRVAELAMLQTLAASDSAKVLFLAPFRSLAFEMEQTLSRTFRPLGYEVSHLYGGARTNRSETEIATEARIIIATPEKARALFRAAPDVFAEIKLIVIDEGHLLGPNSRDVRNEMYYEHLRVRARHTGARLLLLSAALPNADQIAGWIASDPAHLGESTWRPSLQRYGLLRWNGKRVRLDWKGDYQSFNPQFVVGRPTGPRANAKKFPANRNEAVAATAVRLWADERPVMIFTAQARSVPGMARAVLRALAFEAKPPEHGWPEREWKVFEAICEEELPEDAIEFAAARAGVICHSNSLPAQVRVAMEHLMRSGAPRIVIATKTLAQGVNLGVSTVIVASTLVDKGEFVDLRDFLNIAGRAGRAFVDVEGKILFTVDEQEPKKARAQEKRADAYFGGSPPGQVVSGVLYIVHYLKEIAAKAGVDFAHLLEMAAEDDFSALADKREQAYGSCDLLDDALLSLHEDAVVNAPADAPAIWVEKLFRESLGALQADAIRTPQKVTSGEVVAFLQARAAAALRQASSPEKRKAVVSSSLPFKVALHMFDDIGAWAQMVDGYEAAGESFEALVLLLSQAESWARQNAASLADKLPEEATLAKVREGWLRGLPLRTLCKDGKELHAACRDFYGFTLTWIIHAASQQLRASRDEGRADILARLSLCVELGLPSERACRIFLAGIRSRAAAVEISRTGVELGESIGAIARSLRDDDVLLALRRTLTPKASAWLDLLASRAGSSSPVAPRFRPFSLSGMTTDDSLFARSTDGTIRLVSIDGRRNIAVGSTPDLPFDVVANDPRYCFVFGEGAWRLRVRDPRVKDR